MKHQIFIIDDHPIIREGLARLINQEDDMMCCGEAGDALEALQKLSEIEPDLVTIDISLKGINGIDLTKNILEKYPNMLVLIISMYDESLYMERSLRAGAKGYLMKQEATDYVTIAIRKILKGGMYESDKSVLHKKS